VHTRYITKVNFKRASARRQAGFLGGRVALPSSFYRYSTRICRVCDSNQSGMWKEPHLACRKTYSHTGNLGRAQHFRPFAVFSTSSFGALSHHTPTLCADCLSFPPVPQVALLNILGLMFWAGMVQSARRVATGCTVRCSNPGRGDRPPALDRPWCPLNLYNGYRAPFTGVKRPERDVDHPSQSSGGTLPASCILPHTASRRKQSPVHCGIQEDTNMHHHCARDAKS
jgi:hypothetical protein